MTTQILNTVTTAQNQPGSARELMLLHGLFGSADNWSSRSRVYAAFSTVISVDLRNHGDSPHCEDMGYSQMADDVIATLDRLSIEKCDLLGHSMGGKVAMDIALRYPTRINKLIIVDIAPKAYPPHHEELIKVMLSLPLDTLKRRSDADAALASVEPNPDVRAFLIKSLMRVQADKGPDNYRWRFNLNSISDNYADIASAIEASGEYSDPVLFIKGSLSDYLGIDDRDLILQRFPGATLKVIDQAGHWPHAEKPQIFDHIVGDFLGFDVNQS